MVVSRRDFLRRQAAVLGALALPSLVRGRGATPDKPFGIALLGLGNYSRWELAPALAKECRQARLAAVITGTPSKLPGWKRSFGLTDAACYTYDTMDRIADNPDIDAVYVVTPPGTHEAFCTRSARLGKHVICEKPMAGTVAECDRIIAACQSAGVALGMGYRLHYDPLHQDVARLLSERTFGPLIGMEGRFGFWTDESIGWRLKRSLAGGGALYDVGIYVVHALCMFTGQIPISVTASETKARPVTFAEVDETVDWEFAFDGGLKGRGFTTYSDHVNTLRLRCERGDIALEPAYSYRGLRGRTPAGKLEHPDGGQQARQMDAFARHVRLGEPNLVPGEMGRRDILLLQAILESAAQRRPIHLPQA